jgi:macrolide transport system ATP-binding/permease protein
MWRARRLLLRLLAVVRRGRHESDLSREIDSHLAMLEDDFRARGLTPEAATRAARLALGGADQARERHRDARSLPWLEDLRRDIPYAIRSLSRTPGAAAAAILTLALGIGTTTAVFSLFDSVLLAPLAVERPDELRAVRQAVLLGPRLAKSSTYMPYEFFRALRKQPEAFSEVVAFAELDEAVLRANDRDTRLAAGGVFVSDNYFTALGVRARHGRTLSPGDGAGDRALVLGYACWLREFGGDPGAIGRQVRVNGVPFTIAGVTPPAFFGLILGEMPDVFLPLDALSEAQPAIRALADPAAWVVQIVGRLRPGVADTVAGERLTTLRAFVKEPAMGEAVQVLQVVPLDTGLSDVRARFAQPLTILLVMGTLLLVISCANVATLLGARVSSRRSEIAIRAAIGAGKGRLLRQFATESLVLAAVAGSAGVVLASWSTRALLGLMPQGSTPVLFELSMDRRALAFCAAVSLLTALVAGVAPALRAVGLDLAGALRDRSHGGSGGRGHGRAFAVIQVALSVVLVVASTMFATTLYRLAAIDPGFNPENLIQVAADPGARSYRGPALDQYYRGAFDRVRAVAGVRSVSSAQVPLLERSRTTGTVDVPGRPPLPDEQREILIFQVGPEFFTTTGIRVLRGRDFTDQDMTGPHRVAVMNEAASRRFFGAADPIGQPLSMGGAYEVVGVVRGAKYNTLRDEEPAALFVPYAQIRQRTRIVFLVRIEGPADTVLPAVTAAIRGDDPLIPLNATPMPVFVERSLAQERLLTVLSVFFAAAALVLLAVSLYGTMAFWVTERTSEIGVHLALGAGRGQVRWAVLRQPLRLAGIGIALGLPAALAGSRAVDSLMFGVGPRDPVIIITAVSMILAVTLAACALPARRASRVDPVTALRCE